MSTKLKPGVIFLCILVVIQCVFSLVASSIGIQAYNENTLYKPYGNDDTRKNNIIYLWSNIGAAIFTVMIVVMVGLLGGLSCSEYPYVPMNF